MRLKEGFSEFDLKGVLFVEFPVELSWRECRDRLGLMIIYTGTMAVFSLWNMKGYFDTIPVDIEEAARIDGTDVNAMAFDADGNPETVFEEAYLLNCAPADVAEKKAAFKFDAIVPGEVPSIEGNFNGTVKVLGSATLGPDADWTANNKDARFYKAVLTR